MPEFDFTELLPLGPDSTDYRLLAKDGVATLDTAAGTFLRVEPAALTLSTETAMRDHAPPARPAAGTAPVVTWGATRAAQRRPPETATSRPSES